MDEGTGILPGLPPVAGKPVHGMFTGGLMTSAARKRHRSMLATDHQPAGEPARPDCAQAHDGGDGRGVLRQLQTGPPAHRARHRRTEDRVHGGQQLALFNAYYDSRCFQPIHIYEATTGKPVAIILRPGKTPDGAEVTLVLRHVIGHIRARWPAVDIVVRGDSHYARPEAMAWCERQRVGYIFGLAGNSVLLRRVGDLVEDAALGRLAGDGEKVRRHGELRYAATSWKVERRVIARVEAGPQGADSRFIVTNLAGLPKGLYEKVYCARGQAENLIKAHKLHLASDRTSCTKATANQFRLLIHTAAYWLLLTLRGLAPRTSFWRDAQFDTIRLCLVKVAGRVTEMVTRIKIALPSAFPYRPASPISPPASPSCHRERRGRMPQHKPFGVTSNPDTSVLGATENHAPLGPVTRPRGIPLNDPA
jgi:hypothetical protein